MTSEGLLPASRNASERAESLPRFHTSVENEWDHRDYSQEDMLNLVRKEQATVSELFKGQITRKTEIMPGTFKLPEASMTFKDVSFTAKNADGSDKVILEPVSGHLPGGELVALMGPSGCGKSTLLDMLANKKTSKYEGTIHMNGHPRDHLFRRAAAYVGQEDVMPEYWRVREAIEFNGLLKHPRNTNVPTTMASEFIDIILSAFGLSGVKDTYIGGPKVRGCSGGQRRRVTLARGVAQRASILFADEPTSGLSATDAELCIKALRIIGRRAGVLIVVVIHQPRPEVASLFDRLILLTAGPGRCVYNGPMVDAVDYWAKCGHPVPQYANPTDVYLDLVTPGGPLDQVATFVSAYQEKLKPGIEAEAAAKLNQPGLTVEDMLRRQHAMAEKALLGPSRLRLASIGVDFPKQVAVLFRRKLTLTRRNPSAIIMPIGMPIVIGILMGLMYQGIGNKPFQNQVSFVFMLLTRICMGGMQLMPSLIEERTVMKYDTSENLYGVGAFIIVSFCVDITLSLIGTLCNALIMYAFSELPWKYFGMIMGWAMIDFFVFDSFFSFLAAWAPSPQIAQVSAIPFTSIFMLFSGFMITKESAPSYLTWVFQISPMGYAIEDIFVNMADDYGPEGQMLVKSFGFEKGNAEKGYAIMATMFILLRCLQVWALKCRNNIQK